MEIPQLLKMVKSSFPSWLSPILEDYSIKNHIDSKWTGVVSNYFAGLKGADKKLFVVELLKYNPEMIFNLEGIDNSDAKAIIISFIEEDLINIHLTDSRFLKLVNNTSISELEGSLIELFQKGDQSVKMNILKLIFNIECSSDEVTELLRLITEFIVQGKSSDFGISADALSVLNKFKKFNGDFLNEYKVKFIDETDSKQRNRCLGPFFMAVSKSLDKEIFLEFVIEEGKKYNLNFSSADLDVSIQFSIETAIKSYDQPDAIRKLTEWFMEDRIDHGHFNIYKTNIGFTESTILEKLFSAYKMDNELIDTYISYYHLETKYSFYNNNELVPLIKFFVQSENLSILFKSIFTSTSDAYDKSRSILPLIEYDIIPAWEEFVAKNSFEQLNSEFLKYIHNGLIKIKPESTNRFIEATLKIKTLDDPRKQFELYDSNREKYIYSQIDLVFNREKFIKRLKEAFEFHKKENLSFDEYYNYYSGRSMKFNSFDVHIEFFQISRSTGEVNISRMIGFIESDDWYDLRLYYINQYSKQILPLLTSQQLEIIKNYILSRKDREGYFRKHIFSTQKAELIWDLSNKLGIQLSKEQVLALLPFKVGSNEGIDLESLWHGDNYIDKFITEIKDLVSENEIKNQVLIDLVNVPRDNSYETYRYIRFINHFKIEEAVDFLNEVVLKQTPVASEAALYTLSKFSISHVIGILNVIEDDYLKDVVFRILKIRKETNYLELLKERFSNSTFLEERIKISIELITLNELEYLNYLKLRLRDNYDHVRLLPHNFERSLSQVSQPGAIPELIELIEISIDKHTIGHNYFYNSAINALWFITRDKMLYKETITGLYNLKQKSSIYEDKIDYPLMSLAKESRDLYVASKSLDEINSLFSTID